MNDPFIPWELLALAALLLGNRVALPRLHAQPRVYWLVQAVDALVLVAALVFGLPGLPDDGPAGWLVAAVMGFHLVQNAALRHRQQLAAEEAASRREQLRLAREIRSEASPSDPPPSP